MDKFESLRAFTQVVEAGGFAAAARALGLSRSAVNKLVANLENDLGVQLLHRSTRRVSPTETGRAFYDRGVQILADLAEAEQAVSQLHAEPRGNLRINAPMSFGVLHLGAAIADFARQYPDLHVELALSDRFIDPIEEGFDVTIRIAEPPDSAALIAHPLVPARRVLCAAPRYLAARGIPQHPDDLRQHTCLLYGHLATGNQWKLIGPDGQTHWVAVTGGLCSNNGQVLQDAAMHGLGIVLLPTFIAGEALRQGDLQIVLPDYSPPPTSVYILYPTHRHLSTKVQLLTEFLHARLGTPQDASQPHCPYWDDGLALAGVVA